MKRNKFFLGMSIFSMTSLGFSMNFGGEAYRDFEKALKENDVKAGVHFLHTQENLVAYLKGLIQQAVAKKKIMTVLYLLSCAQECKCLKKVLKSVADVEDFDWNRLFSTCLRFEQYFLAQQIADTCRLDENQLDDLFLKASNEMSYKALSILVNKIFRLYPILSAHIPLFKKAVEQNNIFAIKIMVSVGIGPNTNVKDLLSKNEIGVTDPLVLSILENPVKTRRELIIILLTSNPVASNLAEVVVRLNHYLWTREDLGYIYQNLWKNHYQNQNNRPGIFADRHAAWNYLTKDLFQGRFGR